MPKRQPEISADDLAGKKWGFDKRVGPATLINVAQLVTIVWLGATFYTQVNANQSRTDERFQAFTEARKAQDDQIAKMQQIHETMLVQITSMGDKQEATTDAVKDIRDWLRKAR